MIVYGRLMVIHMRAHHRRQQRSLMTYATNSTEFFSHKRMVSMTINYRSSNFSLNKCLGKYKVSLFMQMLV